METAPIEGGIPRGSGGRVGQRPSALRFGQSSAPPARRLIPSAAPRSTRSRRPPGFEAGEPPQARRGAGRRRGDARCRPGEGVTGMRPAMVPPANASRNLIVPVHGVHSKKNGPGGLRRGNIIQRGCRRVGKNGGCAKIPPTGLPGPLVKSSCSVGGSGRWGRAESINGEGRRCSRGGRGDRAQCVGGSPEGGKETKEGGHGWIAGKVGDHNVELGAAGAGLGGSACGDVGRREGSDLIGVDLCQTDRHGGLTPCRPRRTWPKPAPPSRQGGATHMGRRQR